jgi:hypothetical protein
MAFASLLNLKRNAKITGLLRVIFDLSDVHAKAHGGQNPGH